MAFNIAHRELLAAATPTDDAAPKPIQATVRDRQADYTRAEEGPDTPI